jgi:hypothetical protein
VANSEEASEASKEDSVEVVKEEDSVGATVEAPNSEVASVVDIMEVA